jgi:hypothetical protein
MGVTPVGPVLSAFSLDVHEAFTTNPNQVFQRVRRSLTQLLYPDPWYGGIFEREFALRSIRNDQPHLRLSTKLLAENSR